MTAAGVPSEVIEEMQGNKTEEACEVWAENWDVVLFFINRCTTCWKVSSGGGMMGIDRCEIESIMRMTSVKVKDRKPMLDGIQIMESAALTVFRAKEGKSN